jgi:spore coat polysaccharide biosynthesis protein SpsF (cytidylyltransferase family)
MGHQLLVSSSTRRRGPTPRLGSVGDGLHRFLVATERLQIDSVSELEGDSPIASARAEDTRFAGLA